MAGRGVSSAMTRCCLFAVAWVALAAPLASHEKTAGDVVITHPYARATAAVQKNGVIYMLIRNRGNAPERLLAVRTGEAQSAGLHRSTISAEGIARMQPVETLEIPPGGDAKLTSGRAPHHARRAQRSAFRGHQLSDDAHLRARGRSRD